MHLKPSCSSFLTTLCHVQQRHGNFIPRPHRSIETLLAAIFSAFFLKDVEVVGKEILISVSLVIVGGIILIS